MPDSLILSRKFSHHTTRAAYNVEIGCGLIDGSFGGSCRHINAPVLGRSRHTNFAPKINSHAMIRVLAGRRVGDGKRYSDASDVSFHIFAFSVLHDGEVWMSSDEANTMRAKHHGQPRVVIVNRIMCTSVQKCDRF
jgi:hypothetical protein